MAIKQVNPVGTLEELKARGWSPAEYGSCSERAKDNLGCESWKPCQEQGLIRHKSIAGQGPEIVPHHIIKSKNMGGAEKTGQAPCYACVKIRVATEGQGGVFRILEDADGSFAKTVPSNERQKVGVRKLKEWQDANPGEKVPDFLFRGANDPTHPDCQVLETATLEREVKRYPRPSDNKSLMKDLLSSRLREEEIAKRRQQRVDERLNITAEDIGETVVVKPRK
jgi:hypothetical protein